MWVSISWASEPEVGRQEDLGSQVRVGGFGGMMEITERVPFITSNPGKNMIVCQVVTVLSGYSVV